MDRGTEVQSDFIGCCPTNIERPKMIIGSKDTAKVTMEGKFPCVVCIKGIGINSILYQFTRCW